MQILRTVKEVKEYIKKQKKLGKSIGLVPTMGYLHEGHASLIKKSSGENDITIVSVFVNPTQFGVNEDLSTYPRDLEHDTALAEKNGASVIFHPEADEMYPNGYSTYVTVEGTLTQRLCGVSRPTHFRGVTTVVLKLFNIVAPDNAYFGQKDAQQLEVVKRMVKDLNLDINIISCPIVREESGLAKSSRNTYLSSEEKNQAVALHNALNTAQKAIENGEKNAIMIKKKIAEVITSQAPISTIDYIEIVNPDDMKELEQISGRALIAIAVKFPSARLIDNIIIENRRSL